MNDMRPRSFTAEELLALCRPSGVGRVNLIQMSFYVGQGTSGKMAYEIGDSSLNTTGRFASDKPFCS